MWHNVTELYEIKTDKTKKYYTKSYMVEHGYIKDNTQLVSNRLWRKCSNIYSKTEITVYDANNKTFTIYLYGEKTWFYSQEERDSYRQQRKIEYETLKMKNKVLKAIAEKLDNNTLEELTELLEKLQ
jgi:hypothetical protein